MADSLFSNAIWLVAGLIVLALAADRFVAGTVSLATRLRVSPVVAGALIIGFGTSAPEMVVSVLAVAGQGSDGTMLAVGNIVGSNVANLSLVLAIPTLIWGGLVVERGTFRQALLSLAGVAMFALLVAFTEPGLWTGALLVVLLGGALRLVVLLGEGFVDQGSVASSRLPAMDWVWTLLGLAGTIIAAHVVVESSIEIGEELGWTGGFVGFTLVAVGTSLPELVTAAAAARRRHWGLIIGNLLGSNLFNSLGVGAAIFLVHAAKDSGDVGQLIDGLVLVGMVVVSFVAALVMIRSSWSRWVGVPLIALYGVLLWRMAVTATV
ncbi:MAG: sodium:calcium antiporter [Actinomycetota bacterium]|nr:sodium:calcium antiporter [Actinomycetota bacterium]